MKHFDLSKAKLERLSRIFCTRRYQVKKAKVGQIFSFFFFNFIFYASISMFFVASEYWLYINYVMPQLVHYCGK